MSRSLCDSKILKESPLLLISSSLEKFTLENYYSGECSVYFSLICVVFATYE